MVDEFRIDYKYKRKEEGNQTAGKATGHDSDAPVHTSTEKPEVVLNDSDFGKY